MTKHDSKTADEFIVENAQALATNINKHGTTLRIENGEIHAFYGSKEHYAINQASRFDLNEIRWLPDIAELVELRKKNAELEKDIGFLQSCVNSGETATKSDRPSEQAKQLKGGAK